MFLLLRPVLWYKRQWHLRSVQQEPFTNMSGWGGQRVSSNLGFILCTGMPRTSGHSRLSCNTYPCVTTIIHKCRHTCFTICDHTYRRWHTLGCHVSLSLYLVYFHAQKWHSWKVWVCDQQLWECVSAWQNPKETQQGLLLLDKTMLEREKESVRLQWQSFLATIFFHQHL